MTISKDLYLSLFSMDAYNRGYDPKIAGLGGINTQIGNATIRDEADVDEDSPAKAASFYAVAYTFQGSNTPGISNGDKIISYRGTDQPLPTLQSWGDMWTGWTVGAGYDQASQAGLAQAFFEAATGNNVLDIGAGNGTLVTGHSPRALRQAA